MGAAHNCAGRICDRAGDFAVAGQLGPTGKRDQQDGTYGKKAPDRSVYGHFAPFDGGRLPSGGPAKTSCKQKNSGGEIYTTSCCMSMTF
jgi:hypothetical protein